MSGPQLAGKRSASPTNKCPRPAQAGVAGRPHTSPPQQHAQRVRAVGQGLQCAPGGGGAPDRRHLRVGRRRTGHPPPDQRTARRRRPSSSRPRPEQDAHGGSSTANWFPASGDTRTANSPLGDASSASFILTSALAVTPRGYRRARAAAGGQGSTVHARTPLSPSPPPTTRSWRAYPPTSGRPGRPDRHRNPILPTNRVDALPTTGGRPVAVPRPRRGTMPTYQYRCTECSTESRSSRASPTTRSPSAQPAPVPCGRSTARWACVQGPGFTRPTTVPRAGRPRPTPLQRRRLTPRLVRPHPAKPHLTRPDRPFL